VSGKEFEALAENCKTKDGVKIRYKRQDNWEEKSDREKEGQISHYSLLTRSTR